MLFGISVWALWLIAAVALLIIEIVGGTVALLCLALGCIAGAVSSLLGASLTADIIVVALVTVLSFFLAAPAIRRFYQRYHGVKHHISNMDALIGRTGLVTSAITDRYTDGGRVQIDGDSWQAYTDASDAPIPVGSSVCVEHYDSIILHVKPIK